MDLLNPLVAAQNFEYKVKTLIPTYTWTDITIPFLIRCPTF
jgi:hypothetical protein